MARFSASVADTRRKRSGRVSTSWWSPSTWFQSVWWRRGLWTLGIAAIVWYALEGGEYGSSDLLAQKARRDSLQLVLEQLHDSVDALEAQLKNVTSDPARLEKLAREEYGMVKGNKEILYRLKSGSRRDDDSVKR